MIKDTAAFGKSKSMIKSILFSVVQELNGSLLSSRVKIKNAAGE